MSASNSTHRFPWWAALAYDPLPIGGVAGALMLGTYALLRLPPSLPLLVAGVCGTALVYGADRALVHSPEDALNHPKRQRWVQAHRAWLVGEAGVLAFVGAVAIAFLRMDTILVAGLLAGGAGLHLVRVGKWGRPLKTLGLGKPLVVAGAWAVGATLLPSLEAGLSPTPDVWALAGYRLLFLLPNVLLADWGDRRGDLASEGHTWTGVGAGRGLWWGVSAMLGLAVGGAALVSTWVAVPILLRIDAVGALLLLVAVWTLSPETDAGRLIMDGLMAWPGVTALVAWWIGAWPG